ncbi:restriction endonuclease subunit S [Undibacterium sp. SXout20W]|uniref:restriction endonuclease subunit S n=1 Tax=Undibacterium sp. SXout20W TaxID=3413051 RepID=UPI003BEFC8BE
MIKLSDLFDVHYGVNLELNRLTPMTNGINFVSRTAKNNGISATVAPIEGLNPIPSGVLTVAGGGSVLETFLQPEPFYSGRDLYYLVPKFEMSTVQKLYYCACIRANKYRYNYGRQANRTLRDIMLPEIQDIPAWVKATDISLYEGAARPCITAMPAPLTALDWKPFELQQLFKIKKGKRLTKADMLPGTTPYIGSTDSQNGITAFVGQLAIHRGKTISVAYNGSVAEAFYQTTNFWATDDVNVLYPLFEISPEIGLFLCALIRFEKFRFNYGRKWHLERMKTSVIRLPVTKAGKPDWKFMEGYIKTLPYSSSI